MTNKTPHRMAQEAKIARILFGVQLGHREVAAAIGLSRSGAAKYMDRMHAERLIFISGYCNPVTGGAPRPLFSTGRAPDVEYQPERIRKPKRAVPQGQVTRQRVLNALVTPATGKEAGKAAFVSYEQAMKYIKELREEGLVFIHSWQKAPNGGQWAARYMAGKGKDKPHPGQESRASRHKKERAKPEQVERRKRRLAHKRMMQSLGGQPASPFAALGV